MKIGVLGTGMVGQALATKLASLGHDVVMGARDADNPKAVQWAAQQGGRAGTFADAAAHGEVLINCVGGQHVLTALAGAGAKNLAGKVLMDLSNPLVFSAQGGLPTLNPVNDDSLGEQIQRAYPEARVVKTLNTLANPLMVDPQRLAGGAHDVFVSGNDPAAKAQVAAWLTEWFGWGEAIDLGDITTARGVESWLPLWLRLWQALGTTEFNLKIVRGG